MTLPRSLQPRVPWWHPSRLVGYWRRVTGTVKPVHSAKEFKFHLLGSVSWSDDGRRNRYMDLLEWKFYGEINPEAVHNRYVRVNILSNNSSTPWERMRDIISQHPIQIGIVRPFLDGAPVGPDSAPKIVEFNNITMRDYDEWQRSRWKS